MVHWTPITLVAGAPPLTAGVHLTRSYGGLYPGWLYPGWPYPGWS